MTPGLGIDFGLSLRHIQVDDGMPPSTKPLQDFSVATPANQSLHHNINIIIVSLSLTPIKVVRNMGFITDDRLFFSDHVAPFFRLCSFALPHEKYQALPD